MMFPVPLPISSARVDESALLDAHHDTTETGTKRDLHVHITEATNNAHESNTRSMGANFDTFMYSISTKRRRESLKSPARYSKVQPRERYLGMTVPTK